MHNTLNHLNFYLPYTLLLSLLLSSSLWHHYGVDGRVYGDSCSKFSDCLDTKWCNPVTKLCDCYELTVPGVSIIQIFHSLKRSCFSPAGSMCFRQEVQHVYQPKCVPHADCIRHAKVGHLASHFGICTCAPGYFQDYNRLCEKQEEKPEVGDLGLDLGDIYSSRFNGRVGLPADGDDNSVIQKPKAEKVKDDKDNENSNFWIPEEKMDKLARPDSSAGSTLCPAGILYVMGVILIAQLLN